MPSKKLSKKKSAKKAESAENRIAKAKEEAFGEVNKIAQSTTATIVEKLVGAKLSDQDIEQALK